jgi:hypothetical protein
MLDLGKLDKDGLAEYAQNVFGKSLDMRKGIDKLREEVKVLQEKPVVIVEIPVSSATHIKNLNTGLHFPWTPELKQHLGTSGVDCDDNGTPV